MGVARGKGSLGEGEGHSPWEGGVGVTWQKGLGMWGGGKEIETETQVSAGRPTERSRVVTAGGATLNPFSAGPHGGHIQYLVGIMDLALGSKRWSTCPPKAVESSESR